MDPRIKSAGDALWRERGSSNGFTLIEMIIVLAILAMVAGLVIARGPQRSATLEMRQAAGLVAGSLRVARSRAIASNRAVPVWFNPAAATLQVGTLPARTLPVGIAMAVTGAAPGPAIVFRPDGSSSGGVVQLGVSGRRAAVDVNWLTGRVAVAEAQ